MVKLCLDFAKQEPTGCIIGKNFQEGFYISFPYFPISFPYMEEIDKF